MSKRLSPEQIRAQIMADTQRRKNLAAMRKVGKAVVPKTFEQQVLDGDVCGLSNHGPGGCSDPNCPTRRAQP